MSTKTKLFSASLILAASLMTAGIAQAQTADNTHSDPRPTDNRCWGEAASALAQRSDTSVTGGGMGAHSRSRIAADNVGGFRSTAGGFAGSTEDADPTNDGLNRAGAGNVSKGAPHMVDPGDGGMGRHAVNNAQFFSDLVNPVTGIGDGTALPKCSTGLTPEVVFPTP